MLRRRLTDSHLLCSAFTAVEGTGRYARKRGEWQSPHFGKEASFLKRVVTEVIAERDAQIAAALYEVAKNPAASSDDGANRKRNRRQL